MANRVDPDQTPHSALFAQVSCPNIWGYTVHKSMYVISDAKQYLVIDYQYRSSEVVIRFLSYLPEIFQHYSKCPKISNFIPYFFYLNFAFYAIFS